MIAGGTFRKGGLERSAVVLPFVIQEHEVTNNEYRRFDPNHDPTYVGDLPVADVSWYDAAAYALWVGGVFPTEEQREFAARGTEVRR